MSRKQVYKLPVVEKSFVLESKYAASEEEEKRKKWEEERKQIKKESYQQGWQDAIRKNRGDVEHLFQIMNKVIEDLKQERNTIWSKCEQEIIKLVFAIARKAVYEEVSQDNGKIIERVVNDALNRVKEKNILRVYVNPEDRERLKAMKSTGLFNADKAYEIVHDEKISRGGCKVITDCGGVDARIETRWHEIASSFAEHNREMEGRESQQ